MKEKLMLLLHTSGWNIFTNPVSQNVEQIADHLINNGVIVPPCKVGDTVYCLDTYPCDLKCKDCEYYSPPYPGDCAACDKTISGDRAKECIDIIEYTATQHDIYWWLYAEKFGETVFLTKEEAEKALKARC